MTSRVLLLGYIVSLLTFDNDNNNNNVARQSQLVLPSIHGKRIQIAVSQIFLAKNGMLLLLPVDVGFDDFFL